jgi:hypothetical protein
MGTKINQVNRDFPQSYMTAAMLDGRKNKICLHENEFNSSGER